MCCPSHRIVQAWLRDQPFELVICDRLVGEVRSVLTERPRLRKWISLEAAELYITTLATGADLQPDPGPGPALTRDPDNDYVIHLVRAHGRWAARQPELIRNNTYQPVGRPQCSGRFRVNAEVMRTAPR